MWATELGHKYGVTVNAVNPGPVNTDMYHAAEATHLARMEDDNKKVPASPRCATAEDVADIVVVLCEERARWTTGDVVSANGGCCLYRRAGTVRACTHLTYESYICTWVPWLGRQTNGVRLQVTNFRPRSQWKFAPFCILYSSL